MKTKIFKKEDLQEAAELLSSGELVAFPTETVYGLGAVACNPDAVAKVFEAKKRPSFDPLIVHVISRKQVEKLVKELPEKAVALMDAFWPGPLTIILPKTDIVPDIVTSGLETVALRHPNHPIAQKLIELSGEPLAAPSANLFTHTSPTSADVVLSMLDGRIEGIVDEGTCAVGIESTVISLAEEKPTLFRPGGITVEMIKEVIGEIYVAPPTGHLSTAPGRHMKHYAPRTPMLLDETPSVAQKDKKLAQLCFCDTDKKEEIFEEIAVLSPKGDLREAARNLYAAMRRLDGSGVDTIFATSVPQEGLGIAINDRLTRASGH